MSANRPAKSKQYALEYQFRAILWLYQGSAAWHFITLPRAISDEIKCLAHDRKSSWGSVRVMATIGHTHWQTSIFPDTKAGAYLLPVKSAVRKQERISADDMVQVSLQVGAS